MRKPVGTVGTWGRPPKPPAKQGFHVSPPVSPPGQFLWGHWPGGRGGTRALGGSGISDETCERCWQRNPGTGELELHQCGRTLLNRDPTNQAEACLGGIVVCDDCVGTFEEFVVKAYNASAVRQEFAE